jgi:hypothetical protein
MANDGRWFCYWVISGVLIVHSVPFYAIGSLFEESLPFRSAPEETFYAAAHVPPNEVPQIPKIVKMEMVRVTSAGSSLYGARGD